MLINFLEWVGLSSDAAGGHIGNNGDIRIVAIDRFVTRSDGGHAAPADRQTAE